MINSEDPVQNPKPQAGLWAHLEALVPDYYQLWLARVELALAEFRLATESLLGMLMAAVAVIVLGLASWLLFLVLLWMLATELLLPSGLSVLLILLLHLLVITGLLRFIGRKSQALTFPRSLKQLKNHEEA